MELEKKNVVVLGAGFGGLRAARQLGKKFRQRKLLDRYQVVLIDRNSYHTYTPTLYEAATTSKAQANLCNLKSVITVSIAPLISKTSIQFIDDEVLGLDAMTAQVKLKTRGVLPYEYLIFALGSETNFYDIPGLEENAYTLKTFTDALEIREEITEAADDSEKTNFKVVIGGGGSTGVELAAELQLWLCHIKKNKRDGSVCWATITIVEAASSILSTFPPKVIETAKRRLERLGAIRVASEKIAAVNPSNIKFESGKTLPYDLFIWTGGVKANRLSEDLSTLFREESHRIKVDQAMQCIPENDNLKIPKRVFGIGDAVCVLNPKTNKPVPGLARAAMLQANVASHNLLEDILVKEGIKKSAQLRRYRPWNYPYVIPVGGKYAIARIGSWIFAGLGGWIFKGIIELNYLLSLMSPMRAIRLWLRALKIFIQNERLS